MTESASAPTSGPRLVPGWLERLAAVGWRLLAGFALAIVIVWILLLLHTVTASVLVAGIIAATFAPFVLTLRNRGWSRIKAAAAVFLGSAVVIIATIAVIAIAFIPYIADALTAVTTGLGDLKSQLAALSIPPEIGDVIDHATKGIQDWISAGVSDIVGSVATVATIAILATFLTFFFMMDGDKAWVWVLSSMNTWRRDEITTSGHVALERVGGYLRGTAVIAAFDAVVTGFFLLILGVPHAAPLSVIVFFGRFIPYVGPLVTTVLLLLVALGSNGSTTAFILLVLISILSLVQGKFLAPVIYHKTVHIHPALVLIALPAGAAVAGIIGLFVAIPVVAFVLAIAGSVKSILGVGPVEDENWTGLVPIWLERIGQMSWRILVAIGLLAVVIAIAVQVPIVVLPLILGIVLAATIMPLDTRLRGRGMAPGRSALLATAGATLFVIGIIALTVASLAGPASSMIQSATAGASSANDNASGYLGALVALVQTFGIGIVTTIADVIAGAAGFGVIMLLAILLTFYFLRDGFGFWQTFLERIEPGRRSRVGAAGSRAFDVLGGYMLGTGAISAFGAATQFLIMWILGIPFALPLAVLSFFGGFIPYIGSFVTTGLAFLVTVATGDTTDIIVMAIFTIVFNIVQGNFVAPIVYSRVVSLHPAVVLVAIPAGSEIAGIIGMFLVVPFLGVVAATWHTVLEVLDTKPVAPIDPGDAAVPVTDEIGRPGAPATVVAPGT